MQRPMVAAIFFLFVSFSSTAVHSQDTNPAKANCVLPSVISEVPADPSHYPKQDKAKAVIYILVDEKGRVRDPKITTSSGSKRFDRDALDAVRMWRFKPSICDDKPTSVHIAVEMESQVVH